MSKATQSSNARRATVTGLVAAVVGIAILYVAGVEMPVVPPGMVLLGGGAILVAAVHRRWALVVGVLVGLSELLGLFASGSANTLADFASVPISLGNWVRLLGSLTAVIAGTVAFARARPVTKIDGARSRASTR